jgi:hypothetical protein
MAFEFVAKNGLISKGNVQVTSSVIATGFSGSLFGTASWATSASYSQTASVLLGTATSASYSTTSSFSITSSFALGLPSIKSGIISGSVFGGSPRTSSVTFVKAFASNNYSVTVTAENARTWTIQQKSGSGFQINANSAGALSGSVFWQAMTTGEFY